MAGEGAAGGGAVVPIVGTLLQGIIGAKAERKAWKQQDEARRAAVQAYAAEQTLGGTRVAVDRASAQLRPGALVPSVVYRATQPGAPPGTGSGSGPPAQASASHPLLELSLGVLQLLRALGVRLPWDPKPPRVPSFTFNFPSPTPGGVDPMYFMPSSSGYPVTTYGGGDTGWFSRGVGELAAGVSNVIQAIRGPLSMPGGFNFGAPSFGDVTGGASTMPMLGSGCPVSPWAAGSSVAVRAQAFVAVNPANGRAVWFKPAGRPILWSGDLSACKRVKRVAAQARRRLGGR